MLLKSKASWCFRALLLGAVCQNLPAVTIQHDRPDDARVDRADPNYGGVGLLSSSVGMCTAAAIAPMAILTAAHCVDSATPGSWFLARFNTELGPSAYFFDRVSIHPSYQRGQAVHSNFNAQGDIAIGFLRSPLPADVEIYSIWRGTTVPVGAAFVINGFGEFGNGQTGYANEFGIHHYGYNFIEGVSIGGTAFESRFDYQGQLTGCVKLACNDIPQGGHTVGRFESATAPGDSGGPALFWPELDFLARAPSGLSLPPGKGMGPPIIVGINSYGNYPTHSYNSVSGFTFVGAYREWIESHLNVASLFGTLSGPIEGVSFTYTGPIQALPPIPIPEEDPGAVPEPATGILIGLGLGAAWAMRRCSRRRDVPGVHRAQDGGAHEKAE